MIWTEVAYAIIFSKRKLLNTNKEQTLEPESDVIFANPKNLIYNHSLYVNEGSNSPSMNAVILASQEGMKKSPHFCE